MYQLSILGKVATREIEESAKKSYEELWRPLLILIKDKVLTYTEAMNITEEELIRLLVVNKLYNDELNENLK